VLGRIGDGARLLTLTGPGGSGKTRLAIEAAASLVPAYKAGVFWVGLAALRDPALVTETIAQTLGAKDGLAEHIGERELLLLLDNLEQVIAAASELSSLLAACPNLTLLVTSRELLRVQGEVEYAVPPLSEQEAVSLFCARAQLEPSDTIQELCARLDNLPLAVELAAGRAKALSPAQILKRLAQRLDLLKGGRDADARQQTLRAAIDWSYELLAADEQRLLARLSVFAGGCTLEAAEEVCAGYLDTLESLLDKSLLRRTEERLWMLETIREYAVERLEQTDEAEELRRRHAEWVAALAEEAEPELIGPRQLEWFDRLEAERDNVRAALQWSIDGEKAALALRITGALSWFWDARHGEGASWLEAALELDASPSALRAKALCAAGTAAVRNGQAALARTLTEQSIELLRDGGDPANLLPQALPQLAFCRLMEGDHQEAAALAQEAVDRARGLNDNVGLVFGLNALSGALIERGELSHARQITEECLVACRELGSAHHEAIQLANMAELLIVDGDCTRAREFAEKALSVATGLNDIEFTTSALLKLAQAALFEHELDGATRFLAELATLSPREHRVGGPEFLVTLAGLIEARGDTVTAVRLSAAAEAEHARAGTTPWRIETLVAGRFLDPARDELREADWRRAWNEGTVISLEEAIEDGLRWLDSGHHAQFERPRTQPAPSSQDW
jgi:predicted ATPase